MQGRAERYRRPSLAERLATMLPAGGRLATLRQRLRPMLTRLLSAGSHPVATMPDGERVALSPAHRHVTWNPHEYRAFKAAVRPGSIVFDVGANAGAYTVLFAQWVGPAGHVHAFEPDGRAFEALTTHLQLNGVVDRTTASSTAVLDRPGSASLVVSDSPGGSRVASGLCVDDAVRRVQAVSIDQVCGERSVVPDVLKIDVEGAEISVLRGARETIAAAGDRLTLFVEMHPQLWPEAGYGLRDMQVECEQLGLEPQSICGGHRWGTDGVCVMLRRKGR